MSIEERLRFLVIAGSKSQEKLNLLGRGEYLAKVHRHKRRKKLFTAYIKAFFKTYSLSGSRRKKRKNSELEAKTQI